MIDDCSPGYGVYSGSCRGRRDSGPSRRSPDSAGARRVYDAPRPVVLLIGVELGQKDIVDLLPDATLLPLGESASAAPVAAHLLEGAFSLNAGEEHGEDARRKCAIRHQRAPRRIEPACLHGDLRLDDCPKFFVQQRSGHVVPPCTTGSLQSPRHSARFI